MRRLRANRGSALLLVPAGLLIVVALGSVAFDTGLILLRQRAATHVASAAVDDAVSTAIDLDRFRRDGTLVLDPRLAEMHIRRWIAEQDPALEVVDIRVTATSASVRVRRTVAPFFGAALGRSPTIVTATARSSAVEAAP